MTAVYYPVPLSEKNRRQLIPGIRYVPPEKKSPMNGPESAPLHPEPTVDPSLENKKAEALFERLIRERSVETERTRLRSRVRTLVQKAVRLIDALTADQRACDEAEAYKQAGELILANLNRLQQGMSRAELTGFEGGSVSLSLDPKRSPAANAQH
jgi:predicted ribosome quality control (RQC) complex YloA/Tae2 family protein